jgi:hypothetical protein
VRLLARVQCAQKINDSILKKNWPKNDANAKDDPHEALVVAYNREMDQLMEANTISSEVEEEDCETCPNGGMTKSDDEEENIVLETPCPKNIVMDEEEGMEPTTLRIKTGYNDASSTLKEIGCA